MACIWYGIFYSFFGWVIEKLFAAVTHAEHRLRRCFVVFPLCPVYGFAMLLILALGAEKLEKPWEQLLLGAAAATTVEYGMHWGYEALFSVRFWDYTPTKCDVNGRICLPFTLLWGVLSMLALRYVQPALARLVSALPEELLPPLLFLLSLDGIFTARILLTTHDIDALTLKTLKEEKRRTA